MGQSQIQPCVKYTTESNQSYVLPKKASQTQNNQKNTNGHHQKPKKIQTLESI